MRATGLGVRPALVDVHTAGANRLESVQAEALILYALGVVGAVEVGAAQNVHVDLFAGHFRIGFAVVALRALAIVARHGVLADRVLSTRLVQRGALIDVDAAAERITGVVRFARANEAADGVCADGVLTARIILALVDV